jgi:hypothetical protein
VSVTFDERMALDVLEFRLRAILPELYQETYETLEPVPMRSAGLKFASDGRVAWNEIWGSFCDLAMAGGPPHKGTLLEPGSPEAIDADPERYSEVTREICRGVSMVTDLPADVSPDPGWIRVGCLGAGMAGWLLRAIVMENVAARVDGDLLDLPAAPGFRLEKEIKNVVTVIAKTCHYWSGHMRRAQQRAIASLLVKMEAESPLIGPAVPSAASVDALHSASAHLADAIARDTGLVRAGVGSGGWLGLECHTVATAVWMMRALVVSNVLARREGTVLLVPVNPVADRGGVAVAGFVARVHRLAHLRTRP